MEPDSQVIAPLYLQQDISFYTAQLIFAEGNLVSPTAKFVCSHKIMPYGRQYSEWEKQQQQLGSALYLNIQLYLNIVV